MARKQPPPITLCDQDGEETTVFAWAITDPDGRTFNLDLCEKHSKPLRTLASKGILRLTREQAKLARQMAARRGAPPLPREG